MSEYSEVHCDDCTSFLCYTSYDGPIGRMVCASCLCIEEEAESNGEDSYDD